MDINCDLGEGTGNDKMIMPFITSCNIACGGHAGDERSISETIRLARQYGVNIGAHPSFPDRKNFGRTAMDISAIKLKEELLKQIFTISEISKREHIKLHHLKPHGALYNLAVNNKEIAMTLIEVMQEAGKDMILYVPYNSLIAVLSQQYKIPYFYEVFADRAYRDDLSLVSRKETGALIEDPQQIYTRVKQMITENKVVTITGKTVLIKADTVCIHGDNPKAVEIAKLLNTLI